MCMFSGAQRTISGASVRCCTVVARNSFRQFNDFEARGRHIEHAKIGNHAMDDT